MTSPVGKKRKQLGLGRLCESPIVDTIGENNRPMR